jgi:hypothetical protein
VRIRFRSLAAAGLVLAAAAMPVLPGAKADEGGLSSPNVSHVANLKYPVKDYQPSFFPEDLADTGIDIGHAQAGTDMETTTLTVDGQPRDFVVGGTYENGLQLVDVTDPVHPVLAQSYDCQVAQGDVQVFTRDGHTYALYAADDISGSTDRNSTCFLDVGFPGGRNGYGTFIMDITNPYVTEGPDRVRAVGFATWRWGSHNTTIDPSGSFIYNSNQDLEPSYQIEVFDIRGDNLTSPKLAYKLPLSTGLGPHDITFNADGSRAYVAALSHSLILDTTDLAAPKVVGTVVDPAISIHHQADPITVDDPILGTRTFMVVSDELAGVIQGSGACPGGGLHIYDVTGDLERTPVKVGAFFIPQVAPPGQVAHLRCSAHVFRAYKAPDGRNLMTIAWYGAGVRVLDISGLAGVAVGIENGIGTVGAGIKQIGYFFFPDDQTFPGSYGSETWSAKVHHFDPDGSAYIFANDLVRGFDVYRFDASKPEAVDPGEWLAGTTPALRTPSRAEYKPFCVLIAERNGGGGVK